MMTYLSCVLIWSNHHSGASIGNFQFVVKYQEQPPQESTMKYPRKIGQIHCLRPANIANAGMMAMKPKKIDPGKVILDKILSKYSAVFFPGLTPGMKPPFFFKSSAIWLGLIVIAV